MEFKGEAEGKINGLEETMAAQQNQVKEKLEYWVELFLFLSASQSENGGPVLIYWQAISCLLPCI